MRRGNVGVVPSKQSFNETIHMEQLWNTGRTYDAEHGTLETQDLRPNVHTIHPKFYVILVIFNTI